MQSKGAITFVAILIGLACIFQLSFTAATYIQENKASKYAEEVVLAEQSKPSFSEISELDKAFYLDGIRTEAKKVYLDSIANKKVYLGYTYKEVKEKELNLGLDLKGGMNVMLQLDMAELVRSCARDKTTPEFDQVMALARARAAETHTDFITLFAEAWNEVAPNQRMSFDIDLDRLSGDIKNKSRVTNEEIISLLQQEADAVINNSFTVVERRINQFGVAQPNIQKIARTGRILVELPGVKEPERVRKLLQGTASLEFWQTYTYQELQPFLIELNNEVRARIEAAEAEAAIAEPEESVDSELKSIEEELAAATGEVSTGASAAEKANPLFAKLQPFGGNTACIGIAHYRDTADINAWFRDSHVEFPNDFVPAWGFKAFSGPGVEPDTFFELVALKNIAGKGVWVLSVSFMSDCLRWSTCRRVCPWSSR